jgi:hypothetical protein
MAEREAATLHRIKWYQIILSALTACGAVGVLLAKDTPAWSLATALLSFLSLLLNSYTKDIDPGATAQKHRETASDLWNVREAYVSLLTDMAPAAIPLDILRGRRDELQAHLYEIYRAAPHTDGKAYQQAQDALKNLEDLTFTDAEIDAFLPGPLRRARNGKAE